jgi:hypothetical protein
MPYDDIIFHGTAPADLVFLMLDPNPKTRITTRQLAETIQALNTDFFRALKSKCCSNCQSYPSGCNPNIPIHAFYKAGKDLNYPSIPESGLETEVAPNWELANRLWLRWHMWWDIYDG